MITSETYQISASQETVADFVGKPKNLIDILPQDRIENWESTEDGCSFAIKGLAHISLKLSNKSNALVEYVSNSEKPFHFTLTVHINSSNGTSIYATFDPKVNAFMATMLKSPMSNFLNHLGKAIQTKYAST